VKKQTVLWDVNNLFNSNLLPVFAFGAPSVNFINILRARFLYQSLFKAKMYLEKKAFVHRIRAFNVDEIDCRSHFYSKFQSSMAAPWLQYS